MVSSTRDRLDLNLSRTFGGIFFYGRHSTSVLLCSGLLAWWTDMAILSTIDIYFQVVGVIAWFRQLSCTPPKECSKTEQHAKAAETATSLILDCVCRRPGVPM